MSNLSGYSLITAACSNCHYILTVVHETDNLGKNHVPLPPLRAPNSICKIPSHLKKNNQSEPRSPERRVNHCSQSS